MGRKFSCPQCEYTAIYPSKLQTHIKSMHEAKKFPCPQCEYKATRKGSLQTHIRSLHKGRIFQCPFCKHKANYKGNLHKHIKSEHEKDKSQDLKKEFLLNKDDVAMKEYIETDVNPNSEGVPATHLSGGGGTLGPPLVNTLLMAQTS